jgi:hypothetical protein
MTLREALLTGLPFKRKNSVKFSAYYVPVPPDSYLTFTIEDVTAEDWEVKTKEVSLEHLVQESVKKKFAETGKTAVRAFVSKRSYEKLRDEIEERVGKYKERKRNPLLCLVGVMYVNTCAGSIQIIRVDDNECYVVNE